MSGKLTIGPILFHWPEEQKRDFYFKIADEAPVDTVYLGEVICSKRTPFFEQHYDEMAQRLQKGGKTVVYSTLAEVMIKRDRKLTEGFCEMDDTEIEINDSSALYHLSGKKKFRLGQYMNVYNEDTLALLAKRGAYHACLPVELPGESVKVMGEKAADLGITLESQVFGRMPLALSARCYHARAHGRIKDNCQFICESDPDGMELKTLSNAPFLAVNGIQTMSHQYLNLIHELHDLHAMGISHFRLSPHTQDMVKIARIFDNVLKQNITADEGASDLSELINPALFSNGFFYKKAGFRHIKNHQDAA